MTWRASILPAAAATLAFSAASFAQQPAKAPAAQTSWAEHSCESTWRPQPNSQGYWRWEAYHNLDCAIAFIDDRLQGPHEGDAAASTAATGSVTLSRQDLEHLRDLIRAGKDGAMRAAAEGD